LMEKSLEFLNFTLWKDLVSSDTLYLGFFDIKKNDWLNLIVISFCLYFTLLFRW
jgi:hypothetical protein